MLKYAILGFLSYQPMSGYDIKQGMQRSTAYFWNARLSQIYGTLKTLESEGLVTSTLAQEEKRRDRRVYTLTPDGRADLHAWLAQPLTELSEHKETLILKLFFAAQLPKETILTQLHLQHELHQAQARLYRQNTAADIRQWVADHPETQRDAILWEATRRFGELYEEIYARWLGETIALVEEKL